LRVVEEDRRANRFRLQLESPEDLYFASLLIDEGDLVTAWTTRQIKVERGLAVERGERVRVRLTVQVKKVDFQRFSDALRVLGVVVEAPEWLSAKGSHHSICLRPGDELEIVKRTFLKHHEKILRTAVLSTKVLGVISVDIDEVAAALLRPQGLEVLAVVSLPRPGKEGSVKKWLKDHLEAVLPQLVASLRSKGAKEIVFIAPRLASEVLAECVPGAPKLIEVSEGGLAGLYELLRKESLRKLLDEVALSTPRQLLEELARRLHRSPGSVALGPEEVLSALEARAVETLLVVDEALLSDKREDIMKILEKASDAVRNIVVVPPELEGGELLRAVGIAALLYYDARSP